MNILGNYDRDYLNEPQSESNRVIGYKVSYVNGDWIGNVETKDDAEDLISECIFNSRHDWPMDSREDFKVEPIYTN